MPKLQTTFDRVRYVFLDRDGVINRKPPEGQYVCSSADFEILPGVAQAIKHLNDSGRLVLVVTNQRGIALGLYSAETVHALHEKLQQHLATYGAHLDGLYFCPHDRNQCDCRKPATGLFAQAIRDFPEATGANAVVIGDSLSDIKAGAAIGACTVFIEGEIERQKPGASQARDLADRVSASLLDAVNSWL